MSKLQNKLVKGTTNLNKGTVQLPNKENIVEKRYAQASLQQEIIKWNENYVGKLTHDGKDIMEAMNQVQFNNGAIIVQLYHQDFIPESHVIVGDSGKIKSWRFAPPLIDVRRHATDPEALDLNPIPTIFKGVIVGMANDVKLSFIKRKNEMIANGMFTDDFIIPEVGDTVNLTFFMTKDLRFYINKQQKELDIVITPQNYTIENFDYTFKLTEYHIESIIKRDQVGKEPAANYKYRDLIMSVNKPEDIHNIFEINENWEV